MNTLNPSNACFRLIESFESFSATVYMCPAGKPTILIESFESFSATVYMYPAGKPTIGFGHVVLPSEAFPNPITFDQARALLAADMRPIVRYLNNTLPGLNQHQFDALVSFCFNVGIGAFDRSTLRRRIKQGNVAGAAAEFARWNKAGNKSKRPAVPPTRLGVMRVYQTAAATTHQCDC